MSIKLTYANSEITLDLPPGVEAEQFGLSQVDHPVFLKNFVKCFTDASAAEFLADNRPLIIVNDAYRGTPTARILEWLDVCDDTLIDRAHYLVATGTHAAPNDAQLGQIFGSFLPRLKGRVFIHDATDHESMVKVGTDRFGGDVYLNRMVKQYERLLVIGSVEPHFFAGFTGGRKSLFPGLSDLATTERNHNLANSLEAAPMKLYGNPVAEHLEELLGLLSRDDIEKIMTIQIVCDGGGLIGKVCFGPLDEAFEEAVLYAIRQYANVVDNHFDLAIAEIRPPLDSNLYQAQKALENCQAAVADGGAVLIVSACAEGIGSRFFFDQADTWNRETNRPGDGVIRFGSHKLSRVNMMSRRIRIHLHSNLDASIVRRVFIEPVENLQQFVNETLTNSEGKRLAVIHDAANSVLRISNA